MSHETGLPVDKVITSGQYSHSVVGYTVAQELLMFLHIGGHKDLTSQNSHFLNNRIQMTFCCYAKIFFPMVNNT